MGVFKIIRGKNKEWGKGMVMEMVRAKAGEMGTDTRCSVVFTNF
jgi:hypothetical protein